MRLQIVLILVSATIFGFALANCTTEQKTKLQSVIASDTAKTAAPQEPNWKELDHDQRVKYMRNVVLPQMRKTFADFDSKEYERINCKTCHGDGVTDETFKMPNPKLPKLPSTSEGFQQLMKKDSAIMNFMMHKVKPQMAQLLGMPEFNPQTNPKGFGCGNCHTMKQ